MCGDTSVRCLSLLPVIPEQAVDGRQRRQGCVTLRRLRELGHTIEESGQGLQSAYIGPTSAHLYPRCVLQGKDVARELEDLAQQQRRFPVHRLRARLVLDQRYQCLMG